MRFSLVSQIFFSVSALCFFHTGLAAPVKAVATTPDIAMVIKEIGKEYVQVESLLGNTEDPHFADARPNFILKVSRADVVCQVGLDLEVGWLPKVLSRSTNKKVQPGGKGFCDLGSAVEILEKPQGGVDRSMGDVHPQGNPHFWLSPSHLAQASRVVLDVLIQAKPEQQGALEKNHKELTEKLKSLQERLAGELKSAAPTEEKRRFVEYHREFSYLAHAYSLKSLGTLEEKPGVPPSAGRIVQVATEMKKEQPVGMLAASTAPARVLNRFTEISGLNVFVKPVSIKRDGDFESYVALQENLLSPFLKK